jgi:hypothetical protein
VNDRLDFILEAAESQEPVLFLVDGEVWEGRIESCLDGVVAAVVRPIRQTQPYTGQHWSLDQIADMGKREPEGDEDAEDELFVSARLMVQQAREYGEMSLAERILKTREEHP